MGAAPAVSQQAQDKNVEWLAALQIIELARTECGDSSLPIARATLGFARARGILRIADRLKSPKSAEITAYISGYYASLNFSKSRLGQFLCQDGVRVDTPDNACRLNPQLRARSDSDSLWANARWLSSSSTSSCSSSVAAITQARSAKRSENCSTQALQMAAPFFSSSGAPWASVEWQKIQASARFMRLAAHRRGAWRRRMAAPYPKTTACRAKS